MATCHLPTSHDEGLLDMLAQYLVQRLPTPIPVSTGNRGKGNGDLPPKERGPLPLEVALLAQDFQCFLAHLAKIWGGVTVLRQRRWIGSGSSRALSGVTSLLLGEKPLLNKKKLNKKAFIHLQ